MKKDKVILIVVLALVIFGAICYCYFFGTSTFLIRTAEYDGIKVVESNLRSANIKYLKSDSDKVIIKVYGSEAQDYNITEDNDKVIITENSKKIKFIISNHKKVEVYLPKGVAIDSKITSGNIDSDLTLDGNIKSTSGNITLDGFKNGNIETTSGNIKINTLENIDSLKSTSGNIKIDKITNINEIIASSGNIKIKELIINNDTNIKTSSGNIRINKFNNGVINARTVSGKQNIKATKGDYFLNVNTTSGDITINE